MFSESANLSVLRQLPYIVLLLTLSLLLHNCAQVAQPPGGKKDTLAPKLIRSIPENKQRNFKGREIELFFNEYIQLENLTQKTIITPGTGITFAFKLRPTSLLLKFNEPFKDSTTYTISFTDAIRDASERNPATNLKLVFSTGQNLDSLAISGNVRSITTGEKVENALIGLYAPRDTLNATQNKPIYYSKTDTSGNFSIENIRSGQYDLIAFQDNNNNFLFNPQTESVGFYEKRIDLKENVSNVVINLFRQNNAPVRIARTESRADAYTLNFDKGIDQYAVRFRYAKDSIPAVLAAPNQLRFFRVGETADTLPITVTVTDSLGLQTNLKHTINFRPRTRRDKPEAFTLKPEPASNEDIEPSFTWKVQFNKPVRSVRSASVQLLADSTQRLPFDTTQISWNRERSQLSYNVVSKARQQLQIKLNRDAFLSVQGDTIAPTVVQYNVLDPEDYGLIRGTVTTDAPNYYVELLTDDGTVAHRLKNSAQFTIQNIEPGKYRLRLHIDRNNNGRWDTGNYALRIEAEPYVFFADVINVRQNFELEGFQLAYPERSIQN